MGLINACRSLGNLHAAKSDFDTEKLQHPLTYLFWECTLACNLACRHCGSSCSPKESRKDELSGTDAKRIFHEIAQDFDPGEITIAVTGGEPLVREDIFDVMGEANNLGFFWGMVTNAVLIDDVIIQKMEKSGMKSVSISIDGDAEAHSVLRGSIDSYNKAMNGLNLLVKHADFLDIIQVTTVVHKHNVNKLPEMHEIFTEAGVKDWRLLMVDPIGRMKEAENRDLLLNGAELAGMLDFVSEKREEKNPVMEISFEESGFLGLKYEGKVRDYCFHCPAGISVGSILHDGAISSCPSLERCMVEGDAKTERFSKVWNERFERYRNRDNTRRKGICAQCKWWNYCEGGSLHLWDWDENNPRLCHYNMLNK